MKIKVNDFNGFCYSSREVEVSTNDFYNQYVNEFGNAFIISNGVLYMSGEHCGDSVYDWEIVRSEKQIDDAFNPDRYWFEKWRKARSN